MTPTPALTPFPPAPVTVPIRQPFSGSPPFVQVPTGALFVVAPAIAEVIPFVFTETVALIDTDGRVTEPAVLILVLGTEIEVEPVGREVVTPVLPTTVVALPTPFVSIDVVLLLPAPFILTERVKLVAVGKALEGYEFGSTPVAAPPA